MKYRINEIIICGVNNPILCISADFEKSNYTLKINDNLNLNSELKPITNYSIFSINSNIILNKKSKTIYVTIYEKDQKINEIVIKNNFILRIIKKIIKEIREKFISFIALIYNQIRRLIILTKKPKQLRKEIVNDYFRIKCYRKFQKIQNPNISEQYNNWIKKNKKNEKYNLKYQPLISIVVPVYNPNLNYLIECIESVLNQTYKNFELCFADDCSTDENIKKILEEYLKKDKRVKIIYRKENGNISLATNSAIEISTGEFIALLDNDDILASNALEEVVNRLNIDNNIDMIYTDEDKILQDRCEPHFKSDYSPDTLLSINYITHFTVIRKSLIEEVGRFRTEYDGAQDYDLFLRIVEKTNKIYHIPKILYHWRISETSTALNIETKEYAINAGKKAIEAALIRRKIKGNVEIVEKASYQIYYAIDEKPLISIVIPTKDNSEILKRCLESIYNFTSYSNYEIILVNNNSNEKKTFQLLESYSEKYNNFKITNINCEFNYSYINNQAVKEANGKFIVLLNNDTEIITNNWLDIMIGYASQKHIGAVGCKLLYSNTTIQHIGVVLGLGDYRVASHPFTSCPRYKQGNANRNRIPYNYSAVTAACLMIKKEKYEEVNGLTEELKIGYNDVDFNLKLIKKGYFNILLPQVEIFHHESQSRGKKNNINSEIRSLLEAQYMKDKWKNLLYNDPNYNINYSLNFSFMLNGERKFKNEEK